MPHGVLDFFDRPGVDAGERFVQQHERGPRRQGPGDLAPAPFATRQGDRGRLSLVGDAELFQIWGLARAAVVRARPKRCPSRLLERGIGVIITDHNVRETLSLVNRAYIIYDGQVLIHGKPREIIENEVVRQVYLGKTFS